jgi:hypothetical protein
VAAIVAAAVTGFAFFPRHSRHDAVAGYITRVNTAGTAFAKQYRDITKAYTVQGAKPDSRAARLDRAATRLSALRADIAAIPAPKDARELRKRLIAFYRAEESVGHEIAQITEYFPRVVAAERPLGASAKAMRATVTKSATPDAQAAALKAYAEALATAQRRLEQIVAPDVLRNAKAAEVARLARVEASVRAVGKALAAHDRKALDRAVKGLGVPDTTAAAALRAGVIAYNRHVRQINKLAIAVETERQRLEQALS